MSEETMKILEMLKEGKISAGEAEDLLDKVAEHGDEVVKIDGDKQVRVKSGKDKPKGFLGWINKILFAFIPMLLGLGLAGFFIYGVFYYLPMHAPQTLLWVFGLVAIIILCITLICIAAIGVGRKAVSQRIFVEKEGGKIEVGNLEKKNEPDNK